MDKPSGTPSNSLFPHGKQLRALTTLQCSTAMDKVLPRLGEAMTAMTRIPSAALTFTPVLPNFDVARLVMPTINFPSSEALEDDAAYLARAGWFYDPYVPFGDFRRAASALRSGCDQEANEMMSAHFEERLDEIETHLAERLPARAPILRSAFAAHRREDFALSILALLAQADGISKELRGGHFFLKEQVKRGVKAQRQTAPYVAKYKGAGSWNGMVLCALEAELPIFQRLDQRTQVTCPLWPCHL